MTSNRCLHCGDTKTHGGNKALSNSHSKILQQQFAEEKTRLEKLNGAKLQTRKVVLPFRSETNKSGARVFL